MQVQNSKILTGGKLFRSYFNPEAKLIRKLTKISESKSKEERDEYEKLVSLKNSLPDSQSLTLIALFDYRLRSVHNM